MVAKLHMMQYMPGSTKSCQTNLGLMKISTRKSE